MRLSPSTPEGVPRGKKMTTKSKFGAILLASIAALSIAALSAPTYADAPKGFRILCLKVPSECEGGGKASVAMTQKLMATLKQVNAKYNRSIKPRADKAGADVWTVGASSGDCEDYVLAKRRALIRAGFPASSLRIAYVKTRKGEGHAVLVVKTNGKDLVLDNLTAAIKPLSQTGYRIVSIQGANPRQWS
jgi:predicted transglutaminase-like cysteine proteinase